MHHTIICLLMLFLFCEAEAKTYDVDCLPAKAWDTGYQVRMVKTISGTYEAALDQLALAGRAPRYRGKVDLTVTTYETNCIASVTTVTVNGLPFEVEIVGPEEAHLISVSNKPVNEHVRELRCELSERFKADLKAYCHSWVMMM